MMQIHFYAIGFSLRPANAHSMCHGLVQETSDYGTIASCYLPLADRET